MIIHESGPKGDRDRRHALAKYRQICRFFWVRQLSDLKISMLSNRELYHLSESVYDRQSAKARLRYTDFLGLTRSKPLAFRWFVRDLVKLYNAVGWRWWAVIIQAPFRYPGFVARSKKRAEEKAEQAKKVSA